MQAAFTSRRVLIGLALLLGVNSQLNTDHLHWVGTVPNAVVKTLADPPASLMRRAAGAVKGEATTPTYVDEDLDTEQLRELVVRAERNYRQLAEENRQLRRQLGAFSQAAAVRGSETIQLLEARVADANLSASNPTLELDKGSRSGVELGDPVVHNANLLAFISDDVGTLRSSATLVTAPESRYHVRFIRLGEDIGADNESSYVYVDKTGRYFYCDVRKDNHRIRVGDLASMADDLYPQAYGYLLGEVQEIREHPDDPTQQARIIVRLPADPAQLREVLIQVQE